MWMILFDFKNQQWSLRPYWDINMIKSKLKFPAFKFVFGLTSDMKYSEHFLKHWRYAYLFNWFVNPFNWFVNLIISDNLTVFPNISINKSF